MSKYKYSKVEQEINNVLNYHAKELDSMQQLDMQNVEERIAESEALLEKMGVQINPVSSKPISRKKTTIVVPNWEELCKEAAREVGSNTELERLFLEEELNANADAIKELNQDYNALHCLDTMDVTISAVGGLLGGAVDILLVGIPQKTTEGLKAGTLSNYIRDWFDKVFPEEEMENLANSKMSKVPFDAQDNRNTAENIDGLSSYYHRLLSLGHDPLLGFIVGVFDIMTGRMTTIDKSGKIVSQVMECYADRKESDIFAAIAKEVIHLKSDITTSMGLPVPLMALFNLLQFGSIGEAEQTIAEIVQGMYYEGYDFIHFCAMSIPTMIIEVFVRLGYAFKRISEGFSIKEAIPFSQDREKIPKLGTMLFIGHSAATAINAGKVYFTDNPMAINYPQWIAFAKYSYTQLKWSVIEKPELREAYVRGIVADDLQIVYDDINSTFEELYEQYTIVLN